MINTLLERQKDNLTEIVTLLESELQAVRDRKPDTLLELVNARELLLERISQTDKELSGHPELEAAKQEDGFVERVEELDALLAKARELTAVNEKVVQQGQIVSAKFRSVLLTQLSKNSLVYDQKGKTQGKTSSRSIKA